MNFFLWERESSLLWCGDISAIILRTLTNYNCTSLVITEIVSLVYGISSLSWESRSIFEHEPVTDVIIVDYVNHRHDDIRPVSRYSVQ